MSNFALYLTGYIVLILGLAIAAGLMGAPPVWIAVGAIVLIGIGIITGVSRTRYRETPPAEPSGTRRVVVDEEH